MAIDFNDLKRGDLVYHKSQKDFQTKLLFVVLDFAEIEGKDEYFRIESRTINEDGQIIDTTFSSIEVELLS